MNPTTHMLSLEEVADELGVSLSTVKEWVKKKLLASFKKGKTRRVSEQALIEFVVTNTVRPKRPDWLTASVESDFWARVAAVVKREVAVEAGKHRGESIAA